MRSYGKSYKEIKAELGVPKSTLSGWFKNYSWSRDLAKNLSNAASEQNLAKIQHLNKVRRAHLARLYEESKVEAGKEFLVLRNFPLFIAGILLYWGAGDKSSRNHIRVSSRDPEIVKLFFLFIKSFVTIKEESIKISLLLYECVEEAACKEYWMKITGLSSANFYKTAIIKRKRSARVPYGICTIGFSSTYFKHKLLKWLTLMPEYLISGK